ncbi:leucine carboxyl methyltransferase [Diplodia corticola]|uniref:Leucine carboxyl methyltransferase 1 n=1 Tax=Diplodia corticola TaxID=236234 RepID=A0A1J9R959_9PEZI|nr:leucine carboxyl methyltransferase [Diplodia corticola]OJD37033.1 leucine carboxyl methyltransferase [Diplodia corticola]
MPASQIPNLLDSLRSGRGGTRGRGRGSRRGSGGSREGQDRIVQQTDCDALGSRLSAVEMGYLIDPFIKNFVESPIDQRSPEINLGTYVRTTAIDRLVDKFLATDPDQPKQIVSLGAGSDTRFFRILSTRQSIPLVYHEIDFPVNARQKVAAIKRSPVLSSVITSKLANPNELSYSEDLRGLKSPIYNIHPLDLRSLVSSPTPSDSEPPLPTLPNLSPTTPTLILSECCLIYLSPDDADSVLDTITTKLIPAPTPMSIILYEPFRPYDSFGKVMISNLGRRGIVLQTLKKYSTLMRQRERLNRFSLADCQAAVDCQFVWDRWIGEEEKKALWSGAKEGPLDGWEEWFILVAHYCVAWGYRDGEGDLFKTAWSDFPIQDPASVVEKTE